MKTETLLLLIGGGAALLWFMDKQNAAPSAAPSGGSTPAPGAVANPSGIGPGQIIVAPPPSPPHFTCPPTQQLSSDGQTCVDLQPSTPAFHPIRSRFEDPLPVLTAPPDPAQRQTGRTGTPGAISGLPLYGGWGR